MGMTVDIDKYSGFCAGVIKAIGNAENFLDNAGEKKLFSLGAIVHNDSELQRLERKGLVTIDREDLSEMMKVKGEHLLIRAHGEPPQTYAKAMGLGFTIVDCTCPVVLALQKKIKETYERLKAEGRGGQIVIFGKIGHAEVLGLTGQVDGNASVIENMKMLENAIANKEISLDRPVEIFSQTTKNPAEYAFICSRLEEMMAQANELALPQFKGKGLLKIHDTICSQVAARHQRLSKFALEHDIVIFVSGKASSNGRVLCDLCKSLNIRTYHISSPEELKPEWFREDDKVGVCGATSTPKWLLEDVAGAIASFNDK